MNEEKEEAPLAAGQLEMAGRYHRPPETPREEIWASILPALAAAPPRPIHTARSRSRWAKSFAGIAAAAAMIALGFALGRSTRGVEPVVAPVAGADANAPSAFRSAAAEHLTESEALLTVVRLDAGAGRMADSLGARTRALLAQTRLLLDSPAGLDPDLRPVLEDLELILAQISVVESGGVVDTRRGEELRLIAEGLDAQAMLPRIQAVLPVLN